VITLDSVSFEMAVALGLEPIGTVTSELLQHMQSSLSQAEDIGISGEPNLEKILTLSPDLIIGLDYYDNIYSSLSGVAPTLLLSFDHSGQWKESFRQLAQDLDRAEVAEQVMQDYRTRALAFQEQMQKLHQENPWIVSVIRIYPDSMNLYLRNSFLGTILQDVGLDRPSSQDIGAEEAMRRFNNPIQTSISLELIPQVDGDVIFIWTGQNTATENQEAEEQLQALEENPLWKQLNAVQAGRVYRVPSYWLGSGPIAAHAVLDDLFKYLLEPQTDQNEK
jgi:iron complex transport system substrate-binding protein